MDLKQIVVTLVAVAGGISTLIELIVKVVTNKSLLGQLFGQYRNWIFGILVSVTVFACGVLYGEHLLWAKVGPADAGFQSWANTCESQKKDLSDELNQAPVLQRENDKECRRKPTRPCVFLYTEEGFLGNWISLPVHEYPDLRTYAFNDVIQSIKLQGDVHAIAWIDINYSGRNLPIFSDISKLPDDFKLKLSSIKIFPGK